MALPRLRANSTEFGQLSREERILRELRDQFGKLSAGNIWFLLAQGRKCQQNFRKRPEVVAARGGDL